MKWLGVLALLGACGGKDFPPTTGGVSLVLDIPNGALDPRGYSTVDVVLHDLDKDPASTRDVVLSAKVATDGTFDLGAIDPDGTVSVEVTLRNDSGAAVGYGRTAAATAFTGSSEVVVPVRRPIAYIAGTVSRDVGTGQTPVLRWTESPATFSDLSAGAGLDGKTQVGSQAVLMITAGPNLYMVTQATSDPNGMLTGPARVAPVSTADHQIGVTLPGQVTGAVIDGAGADDGSALVIGTTTQLFAIDTMAGTARSLADGNFARVALLSTDTGELTAIAIKNRGSTIGLCASSAELWWVPLTDGTATAHRVATGGFSDIATDRGHAYYVDACKGELGEITATSLQMPRSIPGTGTAAGASAGKPTALAISNGKAYIGVETPPTAVMAPAVASLLVASISNPTSATNLEPRTLWTEAAQQVLDVMAYPDVRRQLDASSVVVDHLEIGAGGDYVALTTSAHFHGAAIPALSVPDMTIDTEELRVFDAASGGIIQRYRSWCDGIVIVDIGDIRGWECAAATGQSAPAADTYEHHIDSMTFQFGKK